MLFDYNLRKGSFGNNRTNNAGSTDNSNKAGGGSKSKESNDELSSIFKEILEENNKDKISTSFFANKLKERYDIKDNAMLTKILNTIADNHDDGDGYLSLDDFEMQEKYDEISSQLYSATAGRLGTDKEKFYKILNDENLTGDDWANIIQTYENIYNRNLIDDVDSDFSGITESNVRNEIMKKITSKLLESIESGSDFALEIAFSELYASLKQTTNMGGKEVLDSNKADEFAINLLSGDDKINAMILSKYSQITGSNLIEDIQKNDSISKANKDLILHRLDVANTYILSEFGNNQSAFEELNLDNYPDSAKNKAWTINLLIQGLNSSLVDFQNQNDEDGSITANYNLIKALTGLGLSSQDLVSAFEEQETLIYELTKALNGESELSFEETFKKLTGVDYDEEKIIKYQELSNQYSIAYSSIQSAQMFQESVSNADNLQDVLNLFISYFGDETRGKEEFLAYLQDGMIPAQDDFDDTNQKTVAFGGYVTDISFDDNGQLVITRINNYNYKRNGEDDEIETLSYDLAETTNMIRTLPRTFDNNKFVNQVIGNIEDCFGYTIENLQEEYYNAKKEALGGADKLEETINEYCQSQSNFIDKLAGVTQVAGMVTIATGGVVTFINPPAGVAIMGAGRYMALGGMFGDNILKAVDGLSSANGLTKDEARALIRETLKEVGYLALGGKINSVAEAVQAGAFESLTSLGVSKGTATVLSWLAEGGTDMALSVLSDFVITGDANLSGNTIQVLMGILTGVANAKVRHLKEQRIAELEQKFESGEYTKADIDEYAELAFHGTPKESGKIDDSNVKTSDPNIKVNDPNVVVSNKQYASYTRGTSLVQGQQYEVATGTSLKIGNTILSLDDLSLKPGETITVGRSGFGADYQIADNTVSRSHLKITATENGYIVVDTNSTNGTTFQFSPLVLPNSDGSVTIYKNTNMSYDTYKSLFEKPYTQQQDNGDCYLLSALNALFENPQSRSTILGCFQETPDGKMVISLPNGRYQVDLDEALKEINMNLTQFNQSSLGFALIEYVYGKERYTRAVDMAIRGYNPYEDEFSQYIWNKVTRDGGIKDANDFRQAGNTAEVMSMFGYKTERVKNAREMAKILSDPSKWGDYVFTISTKTAPTGDGHTHAWDKGLDLWGNHSYLAQPTIENGKVVIVLKNPWYSYKESCRLTPDQLIRLGCFSGLYVIKIN